MARVVQIELDNDVSDDEVQAIMDVLNVLGTRANISAGRNHTAKVTQGKFHTSL